MIRLKSLLKEETKSIHYTPESAIRAAIYWAEKKGYEVENPKDSISLSKKDMEFLNSRPRPFPKAVFKEIPLTKNSVPTNKKLHVRIINIGSFERGKNGEKTRTMFGGQNEFEMTCEIK